MNTVDLQKEYIVIDSNNPNSDKFSTHKILGIIGEKSIVLAMNKEGFVDTKVPVLCIMALCRLLKKHMPRINIVKIVSDQFRDKK